MNERLPNRIPFKVLISISGRLFLLFLFGALLITSLQDLSLKGLIQRAISLGSLFIVIFTINTIVFHYFNKKRKSNLEHIWKKIFFIGLILSFFYFSLHISALTWLDEQGIYPFPNNNNEHIKVITSWSYFAFLFGASSFIYSFIFLIQNSVFTQYEKNQIQMELLQLEASNADAINQLLRQQIQPHFLFNALNILKSLIKRDPQRAQNYLLHLSDFLRVSITKNTTGVSTLEDELKICTDYMVMQGIRFGDALQYQVEIPEDDEIRLQKLPFFSLQPLLENAIKHNKLTEANPLFIKIELAGDYVKISNNLQEKSQTEASTGNGLSMLHERYRILNEEAPIIEKDDLSFAISLKILKDEYNNNRGRTPNGRGFERHHFRGRTGKSCSKNSKLC